VTALPSAAAAAAAAGSIKTYRDGTHRVVPPAQTLDRVRRFFPVMGITRVANVTGLDTIGIPVVMVVRPNSRSLSVSQGKGLDLAAARASGVMESVESWHAERVVRPLKLGSFEELRFTHPLVDVSALSRSDTCRFHRDLSLLWVEGRELLADEPVWVPYETVHTNYTLPLPAGSGCFPITSNGLASGNHLLEAISHALCEVVERDAITLWGLRSDGEKALTRVDLSTVDDPACHHVVDCYGRAGVDVAVWETTSDVGIASFLCMIDEDGGDALRPLYTAMGSGTHPSREVALLRALTEAAQSRLTFISGARDDMWRESYDRYANVETLTRNRATLRRDRPCRSFDDVPSFESDSLADDVAWELERLRSVGINQVVAVDLTRPELRIPVVRVVVPGLEGPLDKIDGYVPGARARAARNR